MFIVVGKSLRKCNDRGQHTEKSHQTTLLLPINYGNNTKKVIIVWKRNTSQEIFSNQTQDP